MMQDQHIQLVARIQEAEDERLRNIIDAFSNGEIEKVAKIVMVLRTTTEILQQHGWAYTMTCLSKAKGELEGVDDIEGYKEFINWVREDTYKVWRN